MAEVTHAGKDHGHSLFIRRRNHLFITQAPTRLNDGSGPGLGDDVETVAERKVSVRGDYCPSGVKPKISRTRDRNLGRVHSAHLTGTNTNDSVAAGQDNG